MQYDFDKMYERRNTRSVKWDLLESEFGRKDVIPMWVADMDFLSPEPIRQALIRRSQSGIYGYSFVPPEFGEVTARWLSQHRAWKIDPNDVVMGNGVIGTLCHSILAFTGKGDRVIIMPPVYPPFAASIRENERTIANTPLILRSGRYEIDFELFEKEASDPNTKMLILCNPHNPIGRIYSREELSRIAEICLKHSITVFSDEIHADLAFNGRVVTPIASLSKEISDICITSFSPSKVFNIAGMYTSAVIISNPELKSVLQKQLAKTRATSSSLFGIDAYIAAYSGGTEEYVRQLNDYLWKNVLTVKKRLETDIPKIKMCLPEATYLLWLDCRELGMSDEELNTFFIDKAGVAPNPGHIFGKEGSGFVRFNIGCPRSMLTGALDKIALAYASL